MTLFIISFIAGVLTVLAPCILPLLPVILAGSMTETTNRRRPFIIIASLSLSVLIFTLLLKGSTALLSVPPTFWTYVSATILLAFGLTLLFPETWARLVLKIPGHNKPDRWISKGYGEKESVWADIVVGAALGPVFTTCSPTFFVILATVLPQSFAMGIVDLAAYIIGLALSLLIIAWVGQRIIHRLDWATNPNGWFRKILGFVFIVLAVLIAFGLDKQIETSIISSGFFDVTKLEQSIHQSLEGPQPLGDSSAAPAGENAPSGVGAIPPKGGATTSGGALSPLGSGVVAPDVTTKIPGERNLGKYVEIAKPAGFVNSAPFKLADLVGKKVIIVDFIDYSCINCQRTFPYMKDWYAKYKDQGLEVVAFHTPEFAFEKDINNVTMAAKMFGLTFPIVLDNDYATWNAYKNQYWPHKYIIDIHGNVVYDHIGEGEYDNTEKEIVKQLNIAHQFLGDSSVVTLGANPMPANYDVQTASPETYFGSERNNYFGNGVPYVSGDKIYATPDTLDANQFYLGGNWHVDSEYIETKAASATLSYVFTAAKMYIIALTPDGSAATATVLIDGKSIPAEWSGADVKDGVLKIDTSRLYGLYSNTTTSVGRHRIDIIFNKAGVRAYTFTFG